MFPAMKIIEVFRFQKKFTFKWTKKKLQKIQNFIHISDYPNVSVTFMLF